MPVEFTLSADRRTLRLRVVGAFTFAQARECVAALRRSGPFAPDNACRWRARVQGEAP